MRLTLFSLDSPEQQEDGIHTPDYIQVENRQYRNERVVMDNHQFRHCSFERCTLVFAGGPFGFHECDFLLGTTPALTGAAYRGVLLWKALVANDEERAFQG